MWDYIESPYLIKRPVPWHSPIMWKYIHAYHIKHHISGETEVAPCLFDFPVQTHLFKQAPWDFSVILLGGVQKAFSPWKPSAGWRRPPPACSQPGEVGKGPGQGCPKQLSSWPAGCEMHLRPDIPHSMLLQLCPLRFTLLRSWYPLGPAKVPFRAWTHYIPN